MTTKLVFKATFTPTAANSNSSDGLRAIAINGFEHAELAPNQFLIVEEGIIGRFGDAAIAVELNKKAVGGTYVVTPPSPKETEVGLRRLFQGKTRH